MSEVILLSESAENALFFFLSFLASLLLGIALIYKGISNYGKSKDIKNTTTEKARSVSVGKTELEGKASEVNGSLTMPFSQDEALYVNWKIQKPSDDGWRTVMSGEKRDIFGLEDDTGTVAIKPTKDTTDYTILNQNKWVETRYDIILSKIPGINSRVPKRLREFSSDGNSSPMGEKRYIERYIKKGDNLYIKGNATKERLDDGMQIISDYNNPRKRLKISHEGQDQLARDYKSKGRSLIFWGTLLIIIAFGSLMAMGIEIS